MIKTKTSCYTQTELEPISCLHDLLKLLWKNILTQTKTLKRNHFKIRGKHDPDRFIRLRIKKNETWELIWDFTSSFYFTTLKFYIVTSIMVWFDRWVTSGQRLLGAQAEAWKWSSLQIDAWKVIVVTSIFSSRCKSEAHLERHGSS